MVDKLIIGQLKYEWSRGRSANDPAIILDLRSLREACGASALQREWVEMATIASNFLNSGASWIARYSCAIAQTWSMCKAKERS